MKIAVVGIGLIGGSIAKELSTRSLGTIEVIGVDSNEAHGQRAIELGLVDRMEHLDLALAECDVLILATPVNVIKKQIVDILDKVSNQQLVIDTGSTKRQICKAVESHANRSRFVAAHPLAGTEYSGPDAAIMDLFKGNKNIICQKELTDEDALQRAIRIFTLLGLQSYFMSPEEHDRHMAYVSHLSHVTSFTLSLAVQDIEKDEKQIFNLASTGFESTVRLAKSNARTWSPIFDANADYLIEAIDLYMEKLVMFKKNIQEKNLIDSTDLMLKANEIRRVLDGNKLNN